MPDHSHIEDLLTHREFLLRIANSIVKDTATAEDVVQDAWLDALRRPPRSRINLRRWLAVIVTRKANRERRRSARQLETLRDRSASVPQESSGGLGAPEAILQRIAESVAGCREPYRRVLLMRFYEGLPPREIARRTELSTNTINSQLQRALALLRRDLVPQENSTPRASGMVVWLRALFRRGEEAAAGDGPPNLSSHSFSRALGSGAIVALVLAVPLLLRMGFLRDQGSGQLVPSGVGDSVGLAENGLASQRSLSALPEGERVALPATPDPTTHTREEQEAKQPDILVVTVLDAAGLPLRGALIQMTGLGLERWKRRMVRRAGVTGDNGRLEIRVGSGDVGEAFGRSSVALWAEAPGQVRSRMHFVPFVKTDYREVTLTMGGMANELRGRVFAGLEPVSGATVTVGGEDQTEADGDIVLWTQPALVRTDSRGEFSLDLAPGGQRVIVTAPGCMPFETRSDALDSDGKLTMHLEYGASVSGVVRNAAGRPVVGAVVFARGEPDRPVWSTRTDARGHFMLSGLPEGPRHLCAWSEESQQAAWSLMDLSAGANMGWDCQLQPEPPLRIKLVGENGQAIPDMLVYISVPGRAPWYEREITGSDSFAEFVPLPPGPLLVALFRAAGIQQSPDEWPHMVVEFPDRQRGTITISVPADSPNRGTLEATMVTDQGTVPKGAILRVLGPSPLLDREVPINGEDGSVRVEHLLEGPCLVGVRVRGRGTFVVHDSSLRSAASLRLGVVRLPAPAELVVAGDLPEGLTLVLFQALGARREVIARTSSPRSFKLQPGSYDLVVHTELGILSAERIRLRQGQTMSWSVPH